MISIEEAKQENEKSKLCYMSLEIVHAENKEKKVLIKKAHTTHSHILDG